MSARGGAGPLPARELLQSRQRLPDHRQPSGGDPRPQLRPRPARPSIRPSSNCRRASASRRPPVLRFLSRDHLLNDWLGHVTWWLRTHHEAARLRREEEARRAQARPDLTRWQPPTWSSAAPASPASRRPTTWPSAAAWAGGGRRRAAAPHPDQRQVHRVLPQLVAGSRRRDGAADGAQHRSARRAGRRHRRRLRPQPPRLRLPDRRSGAGRGMGSRGGGGLAPGRRTAADPPRALRGAGCSRPGRGGSSRGCRAKSRRQTGRCGAAEGHPSAGGRRHRRSLDRRRPRPRPRPHPAPASPSSPPTSSPSSSPTAAAG